MNQAKNVAQETAVNCNYKDTIFRMIFREPPALLELYNAINGTAYTDVNALEIVTLENAIYMNVKNDVACVVDFTMNLYEQQSTVNPNMPLRDLFYVAREYQAMVNQKSLYASKLVKIPTPYFVVFYNGVEKQPERRILNLSDAFEVPVVEPALELKVLQLNINSGYNEALKDKCPLLGEYVEYTERVRRYAREAKLNDAVERAVKECISEGILADFLRKNRAEAISVSIFEYNEELELELFKQAEREEGIEIGEKLGRKAVLVELICKKLAKGKSQEEIAEELEEEVGTITGICAVAKDCGMDVEKICEALGAEK